MNLYRVSLLIQVGFYLVAGINHFRDPGFYLPLIPNYLPAPSAINIGSGILEIALALGLWWSPTRKWASWGIVAMLIAFIPSHVYFIQIGSCIPDGLCTPTWVAWFRLLAIHPFFMGWAAWQGRKRLH
ncbi:MAG TPA: hypothetical protein DCE41_05295 [Cytophagales bacterium]|nr:hypothetical protein [Cytophagales bacterium]HAA17553.1 hypothetical protein [Cytophagales bacterium]HAP63459.1 hypothetical protein [Cytophagales bacterium]